MAPIKEDDYQGVWYGFGCEEGFDEGGEGRRGRREEVEGYASEGVCFERNRLG